VRLLIDEDVPQSVVDFLQERGHEAILVREILLPGAADPVIAAIGDELEAIIVTWNQKDFFSNTASHGQGISAAWPHLLPLS
jgi:predicted nuclease of predicted toxin-antitoxin system